MNDKSCLISLPDVDLDAELVLGMLPVVVPLLNVLLVVIPWLISPLAVVASLLVVIPLLLSPVFVVLLDVTVLFF